MIDERTLTREWAAHCELAAEGGGEETATASNFRATVKKLRAMLPPLTVKNLVRVLRSRLHRDVGESTTVAGAGAKVQLTRYVPGGPQCALELHEAMHLRRWTHTNGRPEDYSNIVMTCDIDERERETDPSARNARNCAYEELDLRRTRRGKEFCERLHERELRRAFDLHIYGTGGYDELDASGQAFLINPSRHEFLTERSKAFHQVNAIAALAFERRRRASADAAPKMHHDVHEQGASRGGRSALPREWRIVGSTRVPFHVETPALRARRAFEPVRVLSASDSDRSAQLMEERYWMPRALWAGLHAVVCCGAGSGRLRMDWPHFHAAAASTYSTPFVLPLASGVAVVPPLQPRGADGAYDYDGNVRSPCCGVGCRSPKSRPRALLNVYLCLSRSFLHRYVSHRLVCPPRTYVPLSHACTLRRVSINRATRTLERSSSARASKCRSRCPLRAPRATTRRRTISRCNIGPSYTRSGGRVIATGAAVPQPMLLRRPAVTRYGHIAAEQAS